MNKNSTAGGVMRIGTSIAFFGLAFAPVVFQGFSLHLFFAYDLHLRSWSCGGRCGRLCWARSGWWSWVRCWRWRFIGGRSRGLRRLQFHEIAWEVAKLAWKNKKNINLSREMRKSTTIWDDKYTLPSRLPSHQKSSLLSISVIISPSLKDNSVSVTAS